MKRSICSSTFEGTKTKRSICSSTIEGTKMKRSICSSTIKGTKMKRNICSSTIEGTKTDEAKYSFLNYRRNENKAKYSFLNYRWFDIAAPLYGHVFDHAALQYCAAHRTFCYFELCSICLREGLGSSKPTTSPWNKHNNTTVGISTISKPYWTVFYRIKWALQVWVS